MFAVVNVLCLVTGKGRGLLQKHSKLLYTSLLVLYTTKYYSTL